MKKTAFIFLVSLLSLSACKKENKAADEKSPKTETTKESTATAGNTEYTISDKDGKTVGGFTINPPKIQFGNNTYTAKEKEDKRKYFANGTLTYEIKLKDDTYKLRDASSKLLWKVKTYPDKIKISDNEENLNPYEVKMNNGSIEVSKDEKVVNTVKVDGDKISVNGTPTFTLSKASNSFALGILSIDQIPMEQRILLLTEFLYQKK